MKQNLKNNGSQSKLPGRFGAEKKKAVIAACLIVVMVSMWVRVFTKKGPQSAVATPTAENVTDDQMNQKLNITFIELPKVKGRNDVLTRDFFTVKDWWDFTRDGGDNSVNDKGISTVFNKNRKEAIRRAAGKLKLEAIVQGENPQAFIDDKLLLVGDKFSVKDGANTFEWEVIEIRDDRVLIKCGETDATLRLTLTPKT
ncbi:MAG: hypothetical protein JW947_08985 [Sedimentisphaerales bacterium]|nr:hypothetical protein [Sedimentisphaerales bacterium]